jgi:hypothetical protein
MIHKKENSLMWENYAVIKENNETKISPNWTFDDNLKQLDWNYDPDMSLYQWDLWRNIVLFAMQNNNTLQITKQKLAAYADGLMKDGYTPHRYDQSLDTSIATYKQSGKMRI